jgi:hypothetical protein
VTALSCDDVIFRGQSGRRSPHGAMRRVLTNLTANDCVNVDSGEMWRGSRDCRPERRIERGTKWHKMALFPRVRASVHSCAAAKNGLTGAPSRSGDDVDRSAGRAGVDERVSWDGRKRGGLSRITIRKNMVKSVPMLPGFEPRSERGRAPRAHSASTYQYAAVSRKSKSARW